MDIKVYYNNVDISDNVDISECYYNDSNGGKQDYCMLKVANGNSIWNTWKPQLNDEMRIVKGECDTGKMFINYLEPSNGIYSIFLMSTPTNVKKKITKIWRNVSLLEIISDVANDIGFGIITVDVTDRQYTSFTQIDETSLEFLNKLCTLEGLNLKIYDGNILVYDERKLKAQKSNMNVPKDDVLNSNFETKASNISSVTIQNFNVTSKKFIKYTAESHFADGGKMELNIKVSNIAEAQRFAENLLYSNTKDKVVGTLKIKYSDIIASGSVINISGFTGYDGKYYITNCNVDFGNDCCEISISKVGE